MSTRYSREGRPAVPGYYKFPMRRPSVLDQHMALSWDQCSTWITAQEWLAWLRRSGSRRSYSVYGALGRWAPRPRPIIHAHMLPWSTRKVSGLARLEHQFLETK